MRIINVANCTPIPNARVDVWLCNETGGYSGYGTFSGQTWMRGIQQTDSEGYVTIKTVFLGWYKGKDNFELTLNGLSNGVYFVKIIEQDKQVGIICAVKADK